MVIEPTMRFGRWGLHDEIASGGMATVYIGRALEADERGRQIVAVKRMHPHLARQSEFRDMFLDEARIVSRIAHRNVVGMVDAVAAAGEFFLVLEYIRGESLAVLSGEAWKRGESIPIPLACAIVGDVLRGLQAAHEAKDVTGRSLAIVHRDVTPHNILVGSDGIARLSDFGVAKAVGRVQTTAEGAVKGKLGYMAPEHVNGARVSAQSDIYSASVVLWELLTGQPMFSGGHQVEVLYRMLTAPVRRPRDLRKEIPPALEAIVLRGLAHVAEERHPSARAMAEALHAFGQTATTVSVGAWVMRLAGGALDRRSEVIARIERGADPSAPAKHGRFALERPRRAWAAGAGAALVLCGGLAGLASSGVEPAGTTSAGAPVAEPQITSTSPAELAPGATHGLPSEAMTPAAVALPREPMARSGELAARSGESGARGGDPAKAKSAAKRHCQPPYDVLEGGRRRYKRACL